MEQAHSQTPEALPVLDGELALRAAASPGATPPPPLAAVEEGAAAPREPDLSPTAAIERARAYLTRRRAELPPLPAGY